MKTAALGNWRGLIFGAVNDRSGTERTHCRRAGDL